MIRQGTDKMDNLDMILEKATPDYIKHLNDEGFEFLDGGVYRLPDRNLCIQITPVAKIGHGHKELDQDILTPTDIVEITFYKCDSDKELGETQTSNKSELTSIIDTYLTNHNYK